MMPQFVRTLTQPLRPPLRRLAQKYRIGRFGEREIMLRRQLESQPRRIVIGASGVCDPGWVATDYVEFDLLRPDSWERYVLPDSIDALLAEHVWERLTLDEGRRAAALCYRFLKRGGYIRVAVPDGCLPDPAYQDYIKVGGSRGGEIGGHQVVYTYRDLVRVFDSAGFTVRLLEYHDESGIFHRRDWRPEDGMIHRSGRFDERGHVSIILDAIK
jgi:predicted SAM-dependent methyltransferase